MARLYIKKKLPKVLIVEGLWNMGKTTLIRSISSFYECKILEEPNHIGKNIKTNVTNWYFQEHKKRFKTANKLSFGKSVIMERSSLSSIAYKFANDGKLPSQSKKIFQSINNLDEAVVIFLYANKKFSKKRIKKMRDATVKIAFTKNPNFYKRYIYFYKNVLPKRLNKKIVIARADYKGKFINPKKIIKTLKEAIVITKKF